MVRLTVRPPRGASWCRLWCRFTRQSLTFGSVYPDRLGGAEPEGAVPLYGDLAYARWRRLGSRIMAAFVRAQSGRSVLRSETGRSGALALALQAFQIPPSAVRPGPLLAGKRPASVCRRSSTPSDSETPTPSRAGLAHALAREVCMKIGKPQREFDEPAPLPKIEPQPEAAPAIEPRPAVPEPAMPA